MGGMGNQMFQYAAGRRLAEKHKTELKLDLTFLLDRTPQENFTYRNYDLDVFNIHENFAKPNEISWLKASKVESLLRVVRKFFKNKKYIEEAHYHFDKRILNAPDNVYLDGYWQSDKYFSDIENIIRKEFTFKFEFDKRYKEMAKKIQSVNAICVNVRRGDYVDNPNIRKFHGVCSLDYYQRSEKIIDSKINKPYFFIFSDDIKWCMKNLRFNRRFTFVTHDYAGKKFGHYLYLMTLCKHYIIANSSFVWWATWLNHNKDKIVISPKKWFRDESINTKDLIPAKWIRI